ncbi:fatty acid desaturase [Amycolatopsis nigrescens]|uniref:fatty acid desaturase n=1 Tax=Amycolatopsis nigrescens TaxID=381445 RepID=UPI00035E54C5|nr:fatty acid desaturase [Amycolatopsis nigrescens]
MSVIEVSTAAPQEPVPPERTQGVPDPGIPLPRVSGPTLLLFTGGLLVWSSATWLALAGGAPLWLTVALHALVTFTMFTVLHEAAHHAAGKLTPVNEILGRLAMPFVAAFGSFPLMRHSHGEHHRNTNEPAFDPAAWAAHGPWWQLPLRWLTADLWYVRFYLRHGRERPVGEQLETVAVAVLAVGGFAALVTTGHGWELLVVYLIPQRIGVAVLAWWFEWLPHHGLPDTRRRNRFGAARIRVGLDWLLGPLMLFQNYHLVHHLHPSVPFYRYRQVWRLNRAAYLARRVPVTTPLGRALTTAEYLALRPTKDTDGTDSTSAVPAAEPVPGPPPEFHQLRIAELRELTADTVLVSFAVPADLRDIFRFQPGQHLTVQSIVDGKEVYRCYSICTMAGWTRPQIAVKRRDGGLLTSRLQHELRPGDTLRVRPPAGRFVLAADPGRTRHYAALAAGSGIAPIISMVSHALHTERHSRCTLLYLNRSGASTLFAAELSELARRFEGRLQIEHHRTDERDPDLHPVRTRPLDTVAEALAISHEQYRRGRLDTRRVRTLLTGRLHPVKVDAWYLCGSQPLVDAVRRELAEHDVPEESVHFEFFAQDRTH